MKLRWLITRNNVTRHDVQREFDKGGRTMKECQQFLEDRQGPKLQYSEDGERWSDVPVALVINTTIEG